MVDGGSGKALPNFAFAESMLACCLARVRASLFVGTVGSTVGGVLAFLLALGGGAASLWAVNAWREVLDVEGDRLPGMVCWRRGILLGES